MNKQIKIGALLSYISIALNIVAGLLYTPWMIEQIGKADYGLYTLANSLITLFLVDFGLSAATGRYIAKYRAEGRQDKIDSFLGAVYKLYLLIDAVIFIALLVFFFLIEGIFVELTPMELEKFKVVYLIAAGFAVLNFPFVTFNGILNSYEKFIPLKLLDIIYRILLILLTVIALLMGYGVYALVAVHAIAGLLIVLCKFIIIRLKTPAKVNFHGTEKGIYKEIFSFSLWVTISMLAQRLVFNITPSILGAVAGSAAIAVFGIVSTIEGYAYTFTTAINGMFMPRISRIYEADNAEDNLMPLFINVGRFQFALNGLIVVGFATVGQAFIDLWVGADYADAYWGILLVTIPGLFFNSLQIANTALIVQKKVNIQAFVNVATGLINVILSVVLSRYIGVIGACISIFVAYSVRAIATHIIAQRVLRFQVLHFIKKCYLRLGVAMLGALSCGFLLNVWIIKNGWLVFLGKGCAVAAIYFFFVVFIGLDRSERTKIFGFVKKKIKRYNK